MALTRIALAKGIGTLLILLGISNVASAAANHAPLGPFLGPTIVLGLLGLLAWWLALRASRSSPREGPNTIWLIAARIAGTLAILYGLGTLALFALVGEAGLAVGSAVLFSAAGGALWAWAIYVGRTIPGPARPAGSGELRPTPPPAAAPYDLTASAPPFPVASDLAAAYRDIDREGNEAYSLARTLARRVVYAHAGIVVLTLALALSLLLLSRRWDPWGLLGPIIIAAYFGLSGWSLARKYAWVDRELRSGRIPPEADLGGARIRRFPAPASGTGPSPPPETIPEERSIIARTLVMLQFGRHMARDSRQFASILFVYGFVFGSIGAYVVTFAALMAFAGGTPFIARDAALAWGATGLTALAVLALLYRIYSRIDQLDRKYRSLESTAGELERAFWSRY